ncbi:maleylpyruvate isomerase family mycothiol-dependent enzyme [Nonomuraea sp. B10E15]|uniref:maleylpyruvate isomerase family mycothiol-dependent enzyme n=1 Tax=Nonomuraea sp. B10E15 TaxID=3153560 RepID=UPI00325D3785
MVVLPALQAELSAATDRLLATAASLSDADLAAPSLLPGWTRGHVLAHVAQNAGSHLNLLAWARTGVRTPQYASLQARATAIEAAATHPVARHLADIEEGASRVAAAIRDMPVEYWSAHVEGMRPPPHPAWYLLVRRLREVGFHHVDLDAGYGPADWPEQFVARELHDCRACWPRDGGTVSEPVGEIVLRSQAGGIVSRWPRLGPGPTVEGAPAAVLAWLTGRSGGEGVTLVPVGRLPTPDPAALPAPPPWLAATAPADLPATPPEDYP